MHPTHESESATERLVENSHSIGTGHHELVPKVPIMPHRLDNVRTMMHDSH